MVGDRFQGHDVVTVEERVREAVDRARKGDGPTFIEIQTYRFRGHSMSDPGKYRSRTELEEKKELDPVRVARDRLVSAGISEDDLEDIEGEVDDEIMAAVQFANEAEPAQEAVMHGTVYVSEVE